MLSDPTTREEIERLVAEAYQLGRVHGLNVLRVSQRQTPQRADEGWQIVANRIVHLVSTRGGDAAVSPPRDVPKTPFARAH